MGDGPISWDGGRRGSDYHSAEDYGAWHGINRKTYTPIWIVTKIVRNCETKTQKKAHPEVSHSSIFRFRRLQPWSWAADRNFPQSPGLQEEAGFQGLCEGSGVLWILQALGGALEGIYSRARGAKKRPVLVRTEAGLQVITAPCQDWDDLTMASAPNQRSAEEEDNVIQCPIWLPNSLWFVKHKMCNTQSKLTRRARR